MTKVGDLVPVLVLQRQIESLAYLGVDVAALRRRMQPLPPEHDALVPFQRYLDMWPIAKSMYDGGGALPTALGMAVPFGAFGALDYLAGSAATVGAVCESVMLHLTMVATVLRLHHEPMSDGSHVLEVVGVEGMPCESIEFTLASAAQRLRYVTQGRFTPLAVGLPVERTADESLRARLWGVPLRYGQARASFVISAEQWKMHTSSADPYLHATLQRIAPRLHLAPAPVHSLERALSVRLRDALAEGRADPQRLAGLLGVSERTMQRRLQALGLSFSQVVEDFRRDEAVRLLQNERLQLVQIAAQLGYTEQTSFTRAFRRWTGETPGAWRAAREPVAIGASEQPALAIESTHTAERPG